MFRSLTFSRFVSFLMIPAVTVLAGMLINSINPEITARTSNHERNYRVLNPARTLSMLAVLLVSAGLGFLTCFFLVNEAQRWNG